MKKTLTAALAAILIVTSLTGCNSDNEPDDPSDSSISNTSSDNTSSDSGSSDNTSSDNTSSDSGSSDNTSSDNTSSDSGSSDNIISGSNGTGDSSSDPGEESYPTLTEGLEFPDTKSGRMVKAALEYNPEDWSMGLKLDDGEMLTLKFPELTVDMFEDYCFVYDMIGIQGHTVFAGKAKAGQEDAVKTAIEKNLDAYKDSVNWYPAAGQSVAGAVNGISDDGYYYFVIHADGSDVASAMLAVGGF